MKRKNKKKSYIRRRKRRKRRFRKLRRGVRYGTWGGLAFGHETETWTEKGGE
jgi:hypothetical protein